MTERSPGQLRTNEPVTLHQTIQMMLGEKLRAHYRPPKKLSHELFVLMMQIREEERRLSAARTTDPTKATRASGLSEDPIAS